MTKSFFPFQVFFFLIILESEEKRSKSSNKKWYLHLPNQIHYTKKSVTFTTELVAVQFRELFMSFHRVPDHSELEQTHKDHWVQFLSKWPTQGLNPQYWCYWHHALTSWANLWVRFYPPSASCSALVTYPIHFLILSLSFAPTSFISSFVVLLAHCLPSWKLKTHNHLPFTFLYCCFSLDSCLMCKLIPFWGGFLILSCLCTSSLITVLFWLLMSRVGTLGNMSLPLL